MFKSLNGLIKPVNHGHSPTLVGNFTHTKKLSTCLKLYYFLYLCNLSLLYIPLIFQTTWILIDKKLNSLVLLFYVDNLRLSALQSKITENIKLRCLICCVQLSNDVSLCCVHLSCWHKDGWVTRWSLITII